MLYCTNNRKQRSVRSWIIRLTFEFANSSKELMTGSNFATDKKENRVPAYPLANTIVIRHQTPAMMYAERDDKRTWYPFVI